MPRGRGRRPWSSATALRLLRPRPVGSGETARCVVRRAAVRRVVMIPRRGPPHSGAVLETAAFGKLWHHGCGKFPRLRDSGMWLRRRAGPTRGCMAWKGSCARAGGWAWPKFAGPTAPPVMRHALDRWLLGPQERNPLPSPWCWTTPVDEEGLSSYRQDRCRQGTPHRRRRTGVTKAIG